MLAQMYKCFAVILMYTAAFWTLYKLENTESDGMGG